ncbi:MAG: NPXTG-anchored protein [Oscillospiraceae bacterium]
MKKIISTIAAIGTLAAVAATASAVTLDKDLGMGWSASITVAGDEFADLTPDSVVKITFTVDETLADMEGQDYWCIKPMVNDAGWPFLNNLNDAQLSEGGDSYAIQPEDTYIELRFSADDIEWVQNAGLAFMGHGIVLDELTIEAASAPADTVVDTGAGDATDAPAKGSPDTGVEGVAVVAGAALAAAGVMLVSRKRK